MKLAICIIASTVAISAAQLNVPGRLRTATNDWGRQRRTAQTQRALDLSMSLSMPIFEDATIDVSMSMSVADEMEWAVPEEPEIILDEVMVDEEQVAVIEPKDESATEENPEIVQDEEDFIDGDFEELKLE